MQAKLNEEAGQIVQLRQNIGQEWAGRALAGEARHQAQDVQHHIADDARARLPPASSGASQNLAAAAILLRAMPEPSTTKGRRIQEELKNLLEDAAVRRAESSASRRQGYPRSITLRLPDSCEKPRSTPGARGTQRLQPRVASATSTTAATVEPTSTRRCAEATTPGVGGATTVGRIGAPRPNHPVCKLSAGPYDGHRSRPGSEPRLPSLSTRGKQGRNCGSRTTGWPASWVERTMTTSSSTTSPVPLRRRPSLARASASCADLQLGRPGQSLRWKRISEAAASSQGNPCETTSGDFRSSAPSCPTSPTQMSSTCSSSAPLAATW
jgi:hypothetical protein